ncbi:MAG: dUTP diphosphatase [Vicinamibacterales bacterium]|jgi:dUTP pyrophosphatase|nr:dUTP diphosphatase [Vicinamibacterales bacterium]
MPSQLRREVRVRRLDPAATVPVRAHPGDAGLDLCAAGDHAIPPGETRLVGTGLAIELPPGTEAQVRPRSGLALQYSVTVLNTPGTVDEGYRGEVGVILINHGRSTFEVRCGMKIAQLVIKPTLAVKVVAVDALSDTSRGDGGFGSTGA